MTILPGSLDYLYYNGILNHIPYEAYQTSPVTPSGIALISGIGNGINYATMGCNKYLEQAQQGYLYQNSTHPDAFVPRESIKDKASRPEEVFLAPKNKIKGVLGAGLFLLTMCCLFKGKKKAAPIAHIRPKSNFWSKLNPKNWFK